VANQSAAERRNLGIASSLSFVYPAVLANFSSPPLPPHVSGPATVHMSHNLAASASSPLFRSLRLLMSLYWQAAVCILSGLTRTILAMQYWYQVGPVLYQPLNHTTILHMYQSTRWPHPQWTQSLLRLGDQGRNPCYLRWTRSSSEYIVGTIFV